MDAISFVLGVRSTHLRGKQLKDLIYREDGGAKATPAASSAYVEAVLNNNGTHIHYRRTISNSGTASTYSVNGKTLPFDQYSASLKALHLNVDTRNFLVFQGDVESIASKSPKELTDLMETISGSAALKQEYNEKKAAKIEAEEHTIFNFQKKRGINAERRQYKEQQDEAQRFTSLLADKSDLKREKALWELYHVDKSLQDASEELQEAEEAHATALVQQEDIDVDIKDKRKQQASLAKQALAKEKKLREQTSAVAELKPAVVRAKEQLAHLNRKLKEAHATRGKLSASVEKQAAEIAELQTSLEDAKAQAEAFDSGSASQAQASLEAMSDLDETALAQYTSLREEVASRTVNEQHELDTLSRQQTVDTESLAQLRSKHAALSTRLADLEANRTTLQARKDKVDTYINTTQERVKNLQVELAAKEGAAAELEQKQTALAESLEAAQERLREAKADRKESEREVRFREALTALMRLFPGVRGRLLDLVQPTQKKYNVALTVVMGRNMEAIVVDDEATAMECIQYLKDQRVGTATFLPLASLKTKPVAEALRSLPSGSKLVLDIVNHDPYIAPAVQFACGNAVVTDNLAEAKRLCFGGGAAAVGYHERVKAVTLDGTVITKSGLMTGGLSGVEDKAKKWDNKQLDSLKRQRDTILKELAECSRKRRSGSEKSSLQETITGLENRIKYSSMDAELTAGKLDKATEESQTLRTELAELADKLAPLEATVAERATAMETLKTSIHVVEDELFADFTASVGVANIREYEERRLRSAQEKADARLALSNTISRLTNQLDYESRRDLTGPLQKLDEAITADEASKEDLLKQEAEAQAAVETASKALETIKHEASATRTLVEEKETIIKGIKDSYSDITKQTSALSKQVSAIRARVDQATVRRSELIRTCKVEEIPLPVQQDENNAPPKSRRAGGRRGKARQAEEDTEDGDTVMVDIPDDAVLDYSELGHAAKRDGSAKAAAAFDERLRALTAQIESMAPNMRAVEHLAEVKTRLEATNEEFEAARKAAKTAAEAFEDVKARRTAAFNDAFTVVSGAIDTIYKELTRSASTPMGGTAFLSLENTEEPYEGGIKFTAQPPMKRFRDMEALSGGEKTVAALALLFAFHSHDPAPFFVLDEIDAALDSGNVARVASYIGKRSGEDIQFVVISLKDTFFARANSLVGISRDPDEDCSSILTLDLRKYDMTAEA